MTGTDRRRLWVGRTCIVAAAMAASWGLVSCGGNGQDGADTSRSAQMSEQWTELADGSYSCDATNTTRSNGPYALDCEKSGDTITIEFANGGHLDLDIDSQEYTGPHSWEITATSSTTGDEWSLTIDE